MKPTSFLPMSVSFCALGAETANNTWNLVAYADGHTCESEGCKRIARWEFQRSYFCVIHGEQLRRVNAKLAQS